MEDEVVEKIKELVSKSDKSKKKPTDEEKVLFMKYWSELAKKDEYRAIKFLLRGYQYDASRILFNYLITDENKDNYDRLIRFLLDEKNNKDDKIKLSFCKILFELAAAFIGNEGTDKKVLAKLLQTFNETHKPEEYFYSSFIQNISQTVVYPDYNLLGMNYYSGKSLNRYLLTISKNSIEYIKKSFVEKTEFKDDKDKKFYEKKLEQKEEKLRRISDFIKWIEEADSKLIKEEPTVEKEEKPVIEKKDDVVVSEVISEKETKITENNSVIDDKRIKELEKTVSDKDYEISKKEDQIIGLSRQIEEFKLDSEKNFSRALSAERENSELNKKILKLEEEKTNLKSNIVNLEKSIDSLKKEIEDSKRMIDVVSTVESNKTDEVFKKIASKLKIEYDEFKEAQSVEMSPELGEVLKDIINGIFDKLNKSGIKVE